MYLIDDDELEQYKEGILEHTIDGQQGFDNYLLSTHKTFKSDNAIVLMSIYKEYVAIYYMQAFNFHGHKECAILMRYLYENITKPIYYVGKTNKAKNNSVEVRPYIYQYKPQSLT